MSLDLEVLMKNPISSVTSPTHSISLLQKTRIQVEMKVNIKIFTM